jgi:alpha-tubulin suppressor-like RCC1 family protein
MDWQAYILEPSQVAIPLATGKRFVDIAAGSWHGLALDSDGRVWSWGRNAEGELGLGDNDVRVTPQVIPAAAFGGAGIESVLASGTSSFALDDLGRIWAWGNNWSGQLGLGVLETQIDQPQMMDMSFLGSATVIELSVGSQHGLLKDTQGCYWSWGENGSGQLGDGSNIDRRQPELLTALSTPGC